MGTRIIIAGGGTGGHIFPAVAIAHALKKAEPDVQLLFVGAKGKMEMEKIPEAGFSIEGINIAGFNRSSLIKNIGLPFKLVQSFLQVRRIVRAFKPDGVIGVGGYSSFPVLRYAQACHIPTFIHESNSFAGKSNRLLGKKATQIFVASAGMQQFFPAAKILITGNPVRSAIANNNTGRETGARFFGLDPAKKTVLATGGSLGAKSINEAIDVHVAAFEENGLQLIWQTGKGYAARAKDAASGKRGIWTDAFITSMECAFAAADVVISRSGAMSIAELCVVGKPVVFVPYPFAAEDHQTVNAMQLVQKNAALLVRDEDAKSTLVNTVIALANDAKRQAALAAQIRQLGVVHADEMIANAILQTLHGTGI